MFHCSIGEWLTVTLEYFDLYSTVNFVKIQQPHKSILRIAFDAILNFSSYVINFCKSLAYYLYSIKDSAYTRCMWSLPDWGPTLHQDSLCRIIIWQLRSHLAEQSLGSYWFSTNPCALCQISTLHQLVQRFRKTLLYSLDPQIPLL